MDMKSFSCVVEVEFCESQSAGVKLYHYFVPTYLNREFKPGDLAVAFGAGGRKCLVEVKSVLALDAPELRATRPIIGFADISAHREREEARKRYDDLIAKLEAMDKRRRERLRWAELAGDDPEAKVVLAELGQLEAKL